MGHIYKIVNLVNNKIYIGSAVNFSKRKIHHICRLNKNKHANRHLQRAWNKYKDFEFVLLEEVNNCDLIKREQYYIDTLNPFYNIKRIADSCLGTKRTKKTCRKISKALTGKKLSQAHKDAISKPILQLDKNLTIIKKYKSTTEASQILNISRRAIGNCLKKRTITSAGFKWIYEKEVTIGK